MNRLHALTLTITLLMPPLCAGQRGNAGSIQGAVVDQTGAAIANAVVTATNLSTGASFNTRTDTHGSFRFLVLSVGDYELSAQQSGFATATQPDIRVSPGTQLSIDLRLSVAPQRELVTVSEAPSLLEPTRVATTSNLDAEMIANLPVNGRHFLDLMVLAPGVVRGPGGSARFAGQNFGDLTLMDGANNTNPLSGQNFVAVPFQVSLSAIGEFQVNVSGYSVELGRASNGIVNAVTRSGTNVFHGNAFWFFRDKGLNATDTVRKRDETGKEPLHVHQFGASLGGPLRKNKLFFFVAYDAQRRNLQNGTFLRLPDGFTLSSNATTAAFQQAALDYLRARATPYPQTDDEDSYFTRVDWQLSSNHWVMARWSSARASNLNGSSSNPQTSLEQAATSTVSNDVLAVSLTSALSPSTLNVIRFDYLGNANRSTANSIEPRADVREAGLTVLVVGRPVNAPQRNLFNQFQWADTVSLSRGQHAVRFGGEAVVTNATNLAVRNFFGNYVFSSLRNFGQSLSGVTGAANNYTQSFAGFADPGVTSHPDSREFDAFVTDQWRLHPRLTLDLGVRYDVQLMAEPPVHNPAPALAVADLDTSYRPLDLSRVSPRFGFAWSPLENGRLVVRGSYGLFSGWLNANMATRPHFQNGISVHTRQFRAGSPNAALIPAYPNTVCGPPNPAGAPPTCPAPVPGSDVLMLFSPHYRQPYNQHTTLGVEAELYKDVALSVTYMMVKGTHLTRWHDVNLPAPVPATISIARATAPLTYDNYSSPRPIAGFDRILAIEATGNSQYHGMIAQLRKRFSANFELLAGYTWGKVIDDHPEPIAFEPGSANETILLSDFGDPRKDRGPGVVDIRHRFVLSGLWELHYADRLSGKARIFFAGWETSGILGVQSGLPYSGGILGTDLNGDGSSFNDRTPGQPRDMFRIPTSVSWDQRLTRNIRFSEGVRMQVIFEGFNLLNHSNYTVTLPLVSQFTRSTSAVDCGIAGTPCLLPQSAFGIPTDSTGPRVMQLAVKVVF